MPLADPVRTPIDDVLTEARRQLTVCNACRYCEGYCAMFPALARRSELTAGDIGHLANVCHDCRACLYACMYAPPHEFGINPPKVLAAVRRSTYDGSFVPRARPARRLSALSAALIGFLATLGTIVAVAVAWEGTDAWRGSHHGAMSPYEVIPYVGLLIILGAPFVASIGLLLSRGVGYWRHTRGPLSDLIDGRAWGAALKEAAQLRYLKGGGAGCEYPRDRPSSLRRRLHGAVAYGFAACIVSTMSAAVEQDLIGTQPPYPWLSVPVISGAAGGIAITLGCAGLIALKAKTITAEVDVSMRSRDYALLSALLILAVTGLAVLVTRTTAVFAPILAVHLAAVGVAFCSAAYTKFGHGLYRLLALVQDNIERREFARGGRRANQGAAS